VIPTNRKVRLQELDSLRGIACLMVFFFHHSIRFIPDDKHYIFHFGYLGVQLFFMISGFVIFLTLERSNWLDFVVHRFTRLYPAYWICVLITFFVMNLSPFSIERIPNFMLYFNLTMFQHWFGIRDLDLAYWTLNLELSFYVIMTIVLLMDRLKNYIAITIAMLLPMWLKFFFPEIVPSDLFHWLTFLSAAHLFAAGILFYHIYKREGKATITEIALLLCCLLSQVIAKPVFNYIEFIHVVLFFFLFLLLTRNKLHWIKNRVLIFYGQISYILYLIHENVGLELLKLFEFIGITDWYLSRGLLLLFFTGFSYLIFSYLEQPLQKSFNRGWKAVKGFSSKALALNRVS
jgi:peptidoglycan/LPS O-acetylase OafA/YrhL